LRKTRDRIRHAISFEVIGLLSVTPLGAWAFGMPILDIGVVGIVGSTIATVWNYVFNLIFDHGMARFKGDVRKTVKLRVAHAVLFETGLTLILVPFVAWYLKIDLLQALIMDFSFVLFYLIYTFVFNWVYDLVFPVPSFPSVGHDA
jgi:uncharacterized membrane protein